MYLCSWSQMGWTLHLDINRRQSEIGYNLIFFNYRVASFPLLSSFFGSSYINIPIEPTLNLHPYQPYIFYFPAALVNKEFVVFLMISSPSFLKVVGAHWFFRTCHKPFPALVMVKYVSCYQLYKWWRGNFSL